MSKPKRSQPEPGDCTPAALAWYRAFREHDIVVPLWRLHRHIGMGGEKYVAAVAGDVVESPELARIACSLCGGSS